ncbi:RNA polymerase sigma factor [Sphingobacterium hungaricum]|uniref:RNA polymerase sigma factor SigS n=1 Tax=Sphingobacterium hungaricum TaxID=2082723 RepID=A0A928UV86_9SPHI|nr:sigma-70 family RNA polymerase sigma factor [Sphingobacterium hungaricum]MBE8713971.1 hypothetical protein [Sphingobacterium hungaricum]
MKNKFIHSSDNELLMLINDRNPHAFTELYNRYKKPLLIYAYQKLENKQEAEDVVSELFIKLWNDSQSIILQGEFRYYVFKMLKNRILNQISSSQRVHVFVESLSHFSNTHQNDTDFLIREKQFDVEIDNYLNRFSDRQKQMVKMRIEGYKNPEIAEELGMSEKTVRNQYSSIVKSIKTKFGSILFF